MQITSKSDPAKAIARETAKPLGLGASIVDASRLGAETDRDAAQ